MIRLLILLLLFSLRIFLPLLLLLLLRIGLLVNLHDLMLLQDGEVALGYRSFIDWLLDDLLLRGHDALGVDTLGVDGVGVDALLVEAHELRVCVLEVVYVNISGIVFLLVILPLNEIVLWYIKVEPWFVFQTLLFSIHILDILTILTILNTLLLNVHNLSDRVVLVLLHWCVLD